MKLTRSELIRAQDAQLRVLRLCRKKNAGWLKQALAREFTPTQVKLFHSARRKPKGQPKENIAERPCPLCHSVAHPGEPCFAPLASAATALTDKLARLESALQHISDHLPRFRDAFDRPDGPQKGYTVWLHDFIDEVLHPDAVRPTAEEVVAALGEAFPSSPMTSEERSLVAGSLESEFKTPEQEANELFEQTNRNLA